MAGAGGSAAQTVANTPSDSEFAAITKTDLSTPISVSDSEFTTPTTMTASSDDYGTITFSDDGTSYADQTAFDTAWPTNQTGIIRGNPTNDNWDINGANNTDTLCYHDMGANLSNTKWVLRFKFNISSVTTTTNGAASHATVCMTSAHLGPSTNQDALGLVVQYCNSGDLLAGAVSLGYLFNDNTVQTATTLSVPVTATNWWVEITRLSTTTFRVKVFSDSAYSQLIADSGVITIPSTIQSLRYLTLEHVNSTGSNGSMTAKVDDFQVWDNYDNSFAASNMKDNKSSPTTNRHRTMSQVNPWVKADMNTAQELLGVALHLHADTTATSIKIETSADDVTYSQRKIIPISLCTLGAWNIILIPRPPAASRYMKITGTDATAKVLAVNEVAVFVLTESVINRRHRHLTYDPTTSAISLTGA